MIGEPFMFQDYKQLPVKKHVTLLSYKVLYKDLACLVLMLAVSGLFIS